MPKRTPLTPDWQAAVRRRTQFYLLAAFLLAVLFGVLVFQFFIQQQDARPQALTAAVFASQDIPYALRAYGLSMTITAEMLETRNVSKEAVPELHNPSTWESGTRFREDVDKDGFKDSIIPSTKPRGEGVHLGGQLDQIFTWMKRLIYQERLNHEKVVSAG